MKCRPRPYFHTQGFREKIYCSGDGSWQETVLEQTAHDTYTSMGKMRISFHSQNLNMNGMQSPSSNQPLHNCSAICGIYQWGHNMAFSEAWQCKGIFAFAYPTDFSRWPTPLQFHRKAIATLQPLSPQTAQGARNVPQHSARLQLGPKAQNIKAGGERGEKEVCTGQIVKALLFYSPRIQSFICSRSHCSAGVTVPKIRTFSKQHW